MLLEGRESIAAVWDFHGAYEVLLKGRFDGGLNLLNESRLCLDLVPRLPAEQSHDCARAGCVAGGGYLLEFAIGDHAQHHGILDVDVGPKGAVINFRDKRFAEPGALIQWLAGQGSLARIRPDESIVLIRDWADLGGRLKGTTALIGELVLLAEKGDQAAA